MVLSISGPRGLRATALARLQRELWTFESNLELIVCGDHPDWPAHARQASRQAVNLKAGVLTARAPVVICDDLRLGDLTFYARALVLLECTDIEMVVGSRCIVGGTDDRLALVRLGGRLFNRCLRLGLSYTGTDAVAAKAFKRAALAETARQCVLAGAFFPLELALRAHRDRRKILEMPCARTASRPAFGRAPLPNSPSRSP